MIIFWKKIKFLNTFSLLEKNVYVAKVINTKRLVTEYSKKFEKENIFKVYIHTLKSSPDISIGYIIEYNSNLFVVNNKNALLLGTPDLRPKKPYLIYKDNYLYIFRFSQDNFLFLLKH